MRTLNHRLHTAAYLLLWSLAVGVVLLGLLYLLLAGRSGGRGRPGRDRPRLR